MDPLTHHILEFHTGSIIKNVIYENANTTFCTDCIFFRLDFYSEACIFNPGVNFDACI